MRSAAVALSLLLLSACAGSVIRKELAGRPHDFDFRQPGCTPETVQSDFTVRYLGSGGVYINWKNDGLLIGPYFSHSGGVVAAQFGHVHFDDERIARGMKDVVNVRAIVFGHSHFDHLGDLPHVAKLVNGVPIYTNDSGVRLLGGYPEIQSRAISVEGQPAFDVPNAAIRITPLKWDHAPQLCRLHHWPCTYAMGEADVQSRPWEGLHLRDLRSGNTYAYVIELLDGDRVVHRIYYNDAAAEKIDAVPDGPYDLAILCMASYDFVRGYPELLLQRLKPHHVLVSHYEDFFVKQRTNAWMFAPLLTNAKANRFIARMNGLVNEPRPPLNAICGVKTDRWSMPVPGQTLVFQ
jgi:L-ascorbate metabolism protein UlaG (beta-lactamase superfamily)